MTALEMVIDILREYGAAVLVEQEMKTTAGWGEFGDQIQPAASDASTEKADAQRSVAR